MSKEHFMLRYGSPEHISSTLGAMKNPNYETQEVIRKIPVGGAHLDDQAHHPDPSVSAAVFENPRADRTKWVGGPHKYLDQRALVHHATPDQVHDAIHGSDVGRQASALHNEHSTLADLKHVAKSALDDESLHRSVAFASIRHNHFPVTHGAKPSIEIPNQKLSDLNDSQYAKLRKTANFRPAKMTDMDTSVLASKSSAHVNHAIQNHLEDHFSKLNVGHHLVLNRKDINADSLKAIGTAAARSDNTHRGLAVTALRHPNITKDAADAIVAANPGSPYSHQISTLHAKIK